jgi:hypothetical protein
MTLWVRYTVSRRRGTGLGHTIDVSSAGVRFVAERPLPNGQNGDVAIDWPALPEGGVQLQLVATGKVIWTNGTTAALKFLRHEFKTRGVKPTAA